MKYIKIVIAAAGIIILINVIARVQALLNSINKLNQLQKELLQYVSRYEKIGYVIKDLKTGAEISLNKDEIFPSASLVKLPIMACVYQAENDGVLSLNDKIKMKLSHKARGSGILKHYSTGSKFSIATLVELMITHSDNTATNMLTDLLGFDYINKMLKKWGLKHTNFSRRIMDLTARSRGIENYTTPQEIAYLLEKIYRNQLVSKEASSQMLSILKNQRIKDRIPRYLPFYTEVAHKTALMRDVCHDAGIIFADNTDILVVVLTKDIKPRLAKGIIGMIAYKTYLNL